MTVQLFSTRNMTVQPFSIWNMTVQPFSTWKYEEERRWLDEVAPSSSYSFPVELSYVTVCFTGFISSEGKEG
jgi:hypothetical protein